MQIRKLFLQLAFLSTLATHIARCVKFNPYCIPGIALIVFCGTQSNRRTNFIPRLALIVFSGTGACLLRKWCAITWVSNYRYPMIGHLCHSRVNHVHLDGFFLSVFLLPLQNRLNIILTFLNKKDIQRFFILEFCSRYN